MFLAIGLFERVGAPDVLVERLRAAGVPNPWVLHARSLDALTAEVPIFGGLRSLATGADADRLIVLSLVPAPDPEELQRVLGRAEEAARQAELNSQWVGFPVLGGAG